MSSTSGRNQSSPSSRSTRLRSRCQVPLPAWSLNLLRSQARKPDGRQLTLCCLPRHTPLSGGDLVVSKRGAHSHRGSD
jgi:urease accessory protein UreE